MANSVVEKLIIINVIKISIMLIDSWSVKCLFVDICTKQKDLPKSNNECAFSLKQHQEDNFVQLTCSINPERRP